MMDVVTYIEFMERNQYRSWAVSSSFTRQQEDLRWTLRWKLAVSEAENRNAFPNYRDYMGGCDKKHNSDPLIELAKTNIPL